MRVVVRGFGVFGRVFLHLLGLRGLQVLRGFGVFPAFEARV